MKKIISVILCTVILCSSFSLAETDYTTYTDEELKTIVNAANNELTRRQLVVDGDILLCDIDDISIYLTRKYEIKEYNGGKKYISFDVIVINNRTKGLMFGFYSASVNGWDVSFSWDNVNASAGHKIKGSISFCISDADISSFEEINSVEVRLSLGYSGALGSADTGILSINPKDFEQ